MQNNRSIVDIVRHPLVGYASIYIALSALISTPVRSVTLETTKRRGELAMIMSFRKGMGSVHMQSDFKPKVATYEACPSGDLGRRCWCFRKRGLCPRVEFERLLSFLVPACGSATTVDSRPASAPPIGNSMTTQSPTRSMMLTASHDGSFGLYTEVLLDV